MFAKDSGSFAYGAQWQPEFRGLSEEKPNVGVSAGDSAGRGVFEIPLWKRSVDLVCLAATLPLWLPLIIAVSVWIKLVSPGPLFYRQIRIGLRGKRFVMVKFRSMKVNTETRTHEGHFATLIKTDQPMTKLDASGDPRLIPWGRLFRATCLDEIPQIWNVLRGEMTLVGPRPCTPNEYENYQPAHRERFNAPPGMTGYWQVNGKNKTTFSQMIAMDVYYAHNMSPWLDFVIISKTIPVIVGQLFDIAKRRMTRRSEARCLEPRVS